MNFMFLTVSTRYMIFKKLEKKILINILNSHVSFVSEILRMNFPRIFLHSSSITYHHHMECIL